ncbi:hypothetical protein QBZ16_001105 [Prototheca wickerhamii]|uniref:Transmembrane protein n=1 Tax=Prototheca wickerhamii TaxID=3111 RepID=A0AAD9MKD4_PROWI|nr:hypothetical protein QBZ16_001105 [Prototheca wickerhamii]
MLRRGALRQLQVVRAQQQLGMFSSPNQEIALLSKKWRTERNLWIAAFAFSAWAGLAAFYREAQRRARAENELQEVRLLREGEAPSRPPSGPPQTDLPLPRVVATPTGDLEVEEVDEQTARRVREAGADDATDEVELTTTSRFEKKDN